MQEDDGGQELDQKEEERHRDRVEDPFCAVKQTRSGYVFDDHRADVSLTDC